MFRNTLIIYSTAFVLSMLFLSITPAHAACATPEFICDRYGEMFGFVMVPVGACEGPDCFDKSYGEECTLTAADDTLFPDKWKIRQSGVLINLNCESLTDSPNTKTTFWMPPKRSCAMFQQTVNHYYAHFFASSPECVGWVQCRIY